MRGPVWDHSHYSGILDFSGSSDKETVVDEHSNIGVADPLAGVMVRPERRRQNKTKRQPRYHVVLWNDEAHSYDYVIDMMQDLFGHPVQAGFRIAQQVDQRGQATCLTTTKEHAELKRDQIHAFGKDRGIHGCKGSMSATIEPDE